MYTKERQNKGKQKTFGNRNDTSVYETGGHPCEMSFLFSSKGDKERTSKAYRIQNGSKKLQFVYFRHEKIS